MLVELHIIHAHLQRDPGAVIYKRYEGEKDNDRKKGTDNVHLAGLKLVAAKREGVNEGRRARDERTRSDRDESPAR